MMDRWTAIKHIDVPLPGEGEMMDQKGGETHREKQFMNVSVRNEPPGSTRSDVATPTPPAKFFLLKLWGNFGNLVLGNLAAIY